AKLESIDFRHTNVGQNELGRPRRDGRQSQAGGVGWANLIAFLPQHIGEQRERSGVVVNDQDAAIRHSYKSTTSSAFRDKLSLIGFKS
ncbi:hypothetical protein Q8G41_28015, partial [Klebsiella pneumoniae]